MCFTYSDAACLFTSLTCLLPLPWIIKQDTFVGANVVTPGNGKADNQGNGAITPKDSFIRIPGKGTFGNG